MRAFAVLCIAAMSAALPCASQTVVAVEHYAVLFHEEGPTPEVTAYVSHQFKGSRHGAFLYTWGERSHKRVHGYGLAGYSLAVANGVQFGLGAGADEAFRMNRAGMMMSVQRGGVEAFALIDGGRGRPWHTLTVNGPTWKHIGARFQAETHLGIGPGINFRVKHFTFWAAMPYDRHTASINPVYGIGLHLPIGGEESH